VFRILRRLGEWNSANYTNSKAQYERQFKKWNFRKNLKQDEWKFIARKVAKRRLDAKETDLYINGVLIPQRKVEKEILRLNFSTTGVGYESGTFAHVFIYIALVLKFS
jgi:hypothetical protein